MSCSKQPDFCPLTPALKTHSGELENLSPGGYWEVDFPMTWPVPLLPLMFDPSPAFDFLLTTEGRDPRVQESSRRPVSPSLSLRNFEGKTCRIWCPVARRLISFLQAGPPSWTEIQLKLSQAHATQDGAVFAFFWAQAKAW